MEHFQEIMERQFRMTDRGRIDKIGDLYTTYNPDVNLEEYKQKGVLDAVASMMEPITMSLDDHDPRVIAYWAKRGMVKEFHGEDEPMSWSEYEARTGLHWEDPNREGVQNRFRQWTSYVPVSAFRKENRDRRYPTVIVLHGGFNPRSIVDGWGFPQEAARREWIVLAPALELSDLVGDMLSEAEKLYPIDPEKVYITGFSYGGFMSDRNALERPELFAAAGPCGAPIGCNDLHQMKHSPEPMRGLDESRSAHTRGIYMPIINCYGNLDGHRYPFYDSGARTDGPVHYTPGEIVDGINYWCDVNQSNHVKLEDVLALKGRTDISPEEKNIGLPLEKDCRHTVEDRGITYYIGDLKSRDNISRIRLICEMNTPHWPTPGMICLLYDFFSHFSRKGTGESVYQESPVRP